MGDIFDTWVDKLPDNRKFQQTQIPKEAESAFSEWMKLSGRTLESSYDYTGAFMAGVQPTQGHLPSFGIGGRLLKSPENPTIWKTAFVEMAHALTGKYIDPDELGLNRESANSFIDRVATR